MIGHRRLRALGFLFVRWSCCSPWRHPAGLRASALRAGATGGPVGARRRPHTSGARAERTRRVRHHRAALPGAGSTHRSTPSMATRADPARARGRLRAGRRFVRRNAAAERSLLGPDPALGARFYGIGNELKSGLAVLAFAAVQAPSTHPPAVAAPPRRWPLRASCSRRSRAGAHRGGGRRRDSRERRRRRDELLLSRPAAGRGPLSGRATLVILSPIAGLLALARSTFSPRTAPGISPAASFTSARRRTFATSSCAGTRRPSTELGNQRCRLPPRSRAVRGRVGGGAARASARPGRIGPRLGGGARRRAHCRRGRTASEDSGPVLFVVAVFTLGCVLAYSGGGPPHTLHRRHGAQPRALKRSCPPAR